MGRCLAAAFALVAVLADAPRAWAQCAAVDPGFAGDLARVVAAMDDRWFAGRPLSDAHNAHRTNTQEELEAAMDGGYNWFEGDVRAEINHPDRLEMRHDRAHERGDNLTLREWLEAGRDAGRGLKIDVKETALMEQLLDTIEEAGIPDERLMLNLGDAGMDVWGAEIRRRFPDAWLAVNPARERGGRKNAEGPIEDWQVDRMIALAERFGGPVTFVLHEGQVTRDAVERLQRIGPVSIWGNVEDPAARAEALRAIGVEGMIDLGEAHGIGPGDATDFVINNTRTLWDRYFPF